MKASLLKIIRTILGWLFDQIPWVILGFCFSILNLSVISRRKFKKSNVGNRSYIGLSFEQPVETLESITSGTLNILEAIRFLDRPIKLYHASSSECFGDVGMAASDENTPFRPRSPYAVAKASAHWLVANYRET